MSPTTVVLQTGSYPCGSGIEGPFIGPELPVLLREFDRVILVPASLRGHRAELPAKVEVVEGYGALRDALKPRTAIRLALGSSMFYREIRDTPRNLLDLRRFRRAVAFIGAAELARRYFLRLLSDHRIDASRCVCYTYWCWEATLGLAALKEQFPALTVVSRAHGYDLYAERNSPSYIPGRSLTLRRLDRLFPVSRDGVQYLGERYPWFAKAEVARLGVPDPGVLSTPSTDGVLRIVSCSYIVPVKRLELLVRGLAEFAKRHPNRPIEWQHFGDGPLEHHILTTAERLLPVNVSWWLRGRVKNDRVLAYYRDRPVDAFVNVSSSEGVPVSIMEAISFGIPVVATAVGGNSEIVKKGAGILLSADPSPDDLADALERIGRRPEGEPDLREGARSVWEREFDAAKNHARFVHGLRALLEPYGSVPADWDCGRSAAKPASDGRFIEWGRET